MRPAGRHEPGTRGLQGIFGRGPRIIRAMTGPNAGQIARAGKGILHGMASVPSARPLRVLHLEDSPLDHELTLAHLKRGGLQVEALRIDSEAEFLAALERD